MCIETNNTDEMMSTEGQSSCAVNIHKETRSTTNTTTATKDETTSSNNVSFSNENKENFRYTPASSATLCKFCGEEPRSNNDENNYAGCLECFKTQLTINKNNSTTTPQSYTLEQLKDASHGEKRKYSRTKCHNVKFSHLSAAAQNDSSSDDEIKDLCSKYKCISSSPPNNKTLTQHASIFKHHQKILCVDRFGAPRPSLNFEKMQQKLLKRNRPRMVRIKTIQPLQSHELTELVAFKPINFMAVGNTCSSNRLVPVEEPMQSGFVF